MLRNNTDVRGCSYFELGLPVNQLDLIRAISKQTMGAGKVSLIFVVEATDEAAQLEMLHVLAFSSVIFINNDIFKILIYFTFSVSKLI